ncbi:MAG: C45 family peptidase, partial [Myxococcota bacterium]
FTITNMTDMRDAVLLHAPDGPQFQRGDERAHRDEGCSSVLVPASRTTSGQPVVGQTWDLNPGDVEYVVAIRRRPTDGPQAWSVTCTGCLSLMGHNEEGLAIGTTNLKTYGSGQGVGYLSILHRSLRCRTIDEAIQTVETAPHAGAHTYWVGDPRRQVDIEASPNGSFIQDTGEGPVWRTNHCLAPEHRELEAEAVGLSTQARFVRLRELLANGEHDVDSIKDVFADRSRGVLSINRYAEDDQGTATNAVFIASPSERKAWACRGPADRGEWIELSF